MAAAFQIGSSVVDREWESLVEMIERTSPGFDT